MSTKQDRSRALRTEKDIAEAAALERMRALEAIMPLRSRDHVLWPSHDLLKPQYQDKE